MSKTKTRAVVTVPAYQVGYQHPPREHCFKPGQSGNPAGRRRGSRNRLNERFLEALCEDFDVHGRDVIHRVRVESPAVYLRVVARLVPTHWLVQETRLDDISDSDLAAYLTAVRAALGVRKSVDDGTDAAGGDEQAQPLPPVPETEDVS